MENTEAEVSIKSCQSSEHLQNASLSLHQEEQMSESTLFNNCCENEAHCKEQTQQLEQEKCIKSQDDLDCISLNLSLHDSGMKIECECQDSEDLSITSNSSDHGYDQSFEIGDQQNRTHVYLTTQQTCDIIEDGTVVAESPSPESARHLIQSQENISAEWTAHSNQVFNISEVGIPRTSHVQPDIIEMYDLHKPGRAVNDGTSNEHSSRSLDYMKIALLLLVLAPPFGIIALYCGYKSKRLRKMGEFDLSAKYNNKACCLSFAGFAFFALIVIVIMVVSFQLNSGAASRMGITPQPTSTPNSSVNSTFPEELLFLFYNSEKGPIMQVPSGKIIEEHKPHWA